MADEDQKDTYAVRRARALRKCTPKMRLFLREWGKHSGSMWLTADKLGISHSTVAKWLRKSVFLEARDLLFERAADEIGVSRAYCLASMKAVADHCVQRVPLTDRKGDPVAVKDAEGNLVPVYATLDSQGAIRAIAHLKEWTDPTVHKAEVTGKDGVPIAAPVFQIVKYDDAGSDPAD